MAFDLPLHGQTPAAADQDLSLPGLARFIADCCDALELADVDLVANDTGGASPRCSPPAIPSGCTPSP